MPQTINIAAGQTALAGAAVTIAPGGAATFSIRSTTAGQPIPRNISVPIQLVTDGVPGEAVAVLSAFNKVQQIAAAGVFQVSRADITAYATDIEVRVDV